MYKVMVVDTHLYQVILGDGTPSAAHLRVVGAPLGTTKDSGCSTIRGAFPEIENSFFELIESIKKSC